MSAMSRGYQMSDQRAAKAEAWTVEPADGQPYENIDLIQDWSYFQPISVAVKCLVDREQILQTAGCAEDAVIGLVLGWRTSKVNRSGRGDVVVVSSAEVTATAIAPRGHVGGTLILEARLVLLDRGHGVANQFAPTEPGSILWSDGYRVTLEGTAPRLAITVTAAGAPPFAGDNNARWLISVDSRDLSLPVDVTVRISLNEANPRVAAMINNSSGEISSVLLASLSLDLNRELVRTALLRSEDFELGAFGLEGAYPDGSLGAAMSALVALWPDDIDSLRARAEYDWAELDVEIQKLLSNEAINE